MPDSIEKMLKSIPDPTDFAEESPGLRALDRAMRCTICSEIFQAPMVLPCGHSFCSYCIRQAIERKEECPTCRLKVPLSRLKKHVQLAAAAVAWDMARVFVLTLSRSHEEAKREKCNGNKRKRSAEMNRSSDAGPSKLRRESEATKDKVEEEEQVGDTSMEVDDDAVPSSEAGEDDIEADCPICHKRIPYKRADSHIESGCRMYILDAPSTPASGSSRAKSKSAWSFLSGNAGAQKGKQKMKAEELSNSGENLEESDQEPSRIAAVTYSTLSEKKLRELLKKHNVPSKGSKDVLAARYKQFSMLHNSNLDKDPTVRKSNKELIEDLQKWEKAHNVKTVEVKDLDKYEKANKDQFAYHIAEARKSGEAKKKAKTENSESLVLEDEAKDSRSSATSSTLQTPPPTMIDSENPAAAGSGEKDDAIVIDLDDYS